MTAPMDQSRPNGRAVVAVYVCINRACALWSQEVEAYVLPERLREPHDRLTCAACERALVLKRTQHLRLEP